MRQPPQELNQELIFKLALEHPEIKMALELWRNTTITWEQATYLMIWSLAESKRLALEDYLKLLEMMPPTPWIIPVSSDKQPPKEAE